MKTAGSEVGSIVIIRPEKDFDRRGFGRPNRFSGFIKNDYL
jgi:hypothetical protein